LREKLCDDKPNKFNHRVALFGMGGVGKTQVAIEYVVKYKGSYNAVFWITAVDLASLLLGFQQIATQTDCGGSVPLDADSAAKEVLKWLIKQRCWLLVLDNVDNISVVREYLPDVSSGNGHILITTRNRDAVGIPAEGLEVKVFDSEAAADMLLLRTNLSDNPIAAVRSEAVTIVGELGFLALAIEQAAGFIRESLKDIFKFLAIYSANRRKMLALRPRQNWAYEHVVSTTWLLSFEVVKNRNPHATELLNLFAFLNPDEILVEFLEVGQGGLSEPIKILMGDALELYNALGDLEQYSLIRRSDDGRIVSIHRLIQQVIRDNLTDQDRRRFMELVAALFLCAFPEFVDDNRQTCRKYQAQVVGPLLAIMELNTTEVAEVLIRVGYFLYADGKYHDGEQFESRAVDMYTVLYGAEDPRTLAGMNNLAATYHDLGRTKEAAALHEKVLKARALTLGKEHEDTLLSMNNLAATYHALGQMKESADLHEKALEARAKTLGARHQHTLSSMSNLGDTYYALGRRKEAADLHEKVLETQLKELGQTHPDTLLSMNNLASTYLALGQTTEAVNLHEKVMEAKLKTLGEDHPDTLMTMHNIATTYYALGRKREAAVMLEKVKESYTKTLGDEHPNTLSSMNNLASTYNSLGQTEEGNELYEKVLEVRSRTLGKEHPDTWMSMYNLGAAFWNSGRRNEALELFESELNSRRAQGAETAERMENLACCYREIGRMEEAEQLESDMKEGEIGQ
jgi:tetratricopeptide (TPR) repeat protein